MLTRKLYRMLGLLAGLAFNILNVCLAGNLPPLGSVRVIVQDQRRYLLLRRPDGHLVFPGGFMRWREDPIQAAKREFREETGLQVALKYQVGCYANTSQNVASMSTVTLVFCGEVRGGYMRESLEGQPCWIEESRLLEVIDWRHRPMLNDYLEQRDQHS